MASYIESTLINDEKIIAKAHLSLWSMALQIALGALLALTIIIYPFIPSNTLGIYNYIDIAICLFGLFLLLKVYLRYISTELAFTNKRVIAKFGFIRRQTTELHISKVESIQVEQGILGRIFNFGTLIISGAGNPQAPIPGISEPIQFRQAFMQYQDQPHA